MNKDSFLRFLKGSPSGRQALRGGSYSLAVSALVLAILVVVNIFVSALPAPVTRYDISASKLYSITSNTKEMCIRDRSMGFSVPMAQENPRP